MEGSTHVLYPQPMCECGRGKLKVQPASSTAHHPGRLYYKCWTRRGSCGYWKWCDEYESATQGKEVMKSGKQVLQSPTMTSMSASSNATEVTRLNNPPTTFRNPEVHIFISYLFMATVLVLLGFIIAKLM